MSKSNDLLKGLLAFAISLSACGAETATDPREMETSPPSRDESKNDEPGAGGSPAPAEVNPCPLGSDDVCTSVESGSGASDETEIVTGGGADAGAPADARVPSDAASESDAGGPADAGVSSDGGMADPPDAAAPCKKEFMIRPQAAADIVTAPGTTLEAEAFSDVIGVGLRRLFAMNPWGQGRYMAWTDSSTLPMLLSLYPVFDYLSPGVAAPRVAAVGYGCAVNNVPNLTPLSRELPASYMGRPDLLAAQFDVILFCAVQNSWSHDWVNELSAYVRDYGKGLFIVTEYYRPTGGGSSLEDFKNINQLTASIGLEFEPVIYYANETRPVEFSLPSNRCPNP